MAAYAQRGQIGLYDNPLAAEAAAAGTADLFDRVPLDQMTGAEQAVTRAAAEIPADASERLNTDEKLSDKDRETIIEIARQALARFQRKPELKEKR